MKTTNSILIVGLILLVVPLAFIVIAAINYTGNQEFSVVVHEDEAAFIMEERVKNDFHYRTYGGHNLKMVSITTPSNDDCKGLWRDYFGNDAVYQTCYEGMFVFSINSSAPDFVDRYLVKTWLLGTTTKGFEITEIVRGEI